MAGTFGSKCRRVCGCRPARAANRIAERAFLFRAALAVAAFASIAVVVATRSRAQPLATVVSSTDEDSDSPQAAPKTFAVRKADSKIVESLEDFQRYSAKRSWELAFHAMNSIDDAGDAGLVPAGDGFYVPLRKRVEQLLCNLPPEGRDAYRLFNDAGAKKLWQQLQDGGHGLPSDEVATLRKLVDHYFMTSVGDLAADRFGDALFEQGNFAAAERAWRLVAEKYPDTHLPLAKLQVKRCIALSMSDRREALAALVAQVREKYADQNVTLGGREVNAAEFAESLLAKMPAAAAAIPSPQISGIDGQEASLPAAAEPAWQIPFGVNDLAGQNDPQTGMPLGKSIFRPACCVDQRRFYANRFGTVFAADLASGKMLWRTGKFSDFAQQAMQGLQQGISPESFFLVATGDKLLAGRIGSNNLLGNLFGATPEPWHIECLDPATGKPLWSYRPTEETIVSAPSIVGDAAYLLGIEGNNSMYLVCVGLADGKQRWTTPLGTPQNNRNWRGTYNFGGPKLLAIDGELYLATNYGALFAIDPATHEIDWALQHDTRPASSNQGMWWGQMTTDTSEFGNALVGTDGACYLKDGASSMLYAIDLAAPAIRWKRLLAADDYLASIDGSTAYLLADDLSALDLHTKKLRWSTKLPGQTDAARLLICLNHVFVPTERGIFDINPANGDVQRIFRGADREAGVRQLMPAGDKLIAIGNAAVTAYPLRRSAAANNPSSAAK